jgi:hypothetical protein
MKILITGGKGYIAKSIYNTLWDSYHIIAPGRDELDLTDKSSVDKFFENKQFDVVIHTAIKGGSRLVEDDESVSFWNLVIKSRTVKKSDLGISYLTLVSGFMKNRLLIVEVPKQLETDL